MFIFLDFWIMLKNTIVVYGKNTSVITMATFLGNQWWKTAKNEPLVPLSNDDGYDQTDYRYLCQKGEEMLMKDLAGIIGTVLENADGDYNEATKTCLKQLTALGVRFQAVPQVLNLEMHLKQNKFGSNVGMYTLICYDRDTDSEPLMFMDYNVSAKGAWDAGRAFIDFFMRHGVKVQAQLKCKGDVADELVGMTQGVKIEIEED